MAVKERDLMWLYLRICERALSTTDERVVELMSRIETKTLAILANPTLSFDEWELSIIKKYVY